MKYFFLAVIWVCVMMPAPVRAQSIAEQYQAILRQVVVILEWQVQDLQKGQSAFAAAPVGTLTTGFQTSRRINRGGGGRRSTSTPPVILPAPAFTITGLGNTVTITSDLPLQPQTFTVTLLDFSEEVAIPVVAPIHVAAFLTTGGYVDVELIPHGDGTIHEAALPGLLNPGEAYSGVFTTLFPEEIADEYIGYVVSYQGNGTSSLTVTLVNSGTALLTLITSADNPAPATVMVGRSTQTLAVPVLALGLQATGGGRVILDQLVIDVGSEPEVPVTKVIAEARLVGAGEVFRAEVTDTALVFSNLTFTTERDLFYTFVLEVDLLPQAENYNFTQTLTFGLEVASIQAFLSGQADPLEAVAGEAVYSNEQRLVPQSIFVPADTFSSNFVTLNEFATAAEFTLEFSVQAFFGDFYLKQAAVLVSENPSSGVSFAITGDYGAGSVTATLTATAEEVTSGVFVVRAEEIKTFTLTVQMTTAASGDFRITLAEVWSTLALDGETATNSFLLAPAADFTTPAQTIVGPG